jgi:hypothetical protein
MAKRMKLKQKLADFEEAYDRYTSAILEVVGKEKYNEILKRYWEMKSQEKTPE